MKTLLLSTTLSVFFFVQTISAQSKYKHYYLVKDSIGYKVRYYDTNGDRKDSTHYLRLQRTNGDINEAINRRIAHNNRLRASVMFESEKSDKLLVNNWLVKGKDDNFVDRDTVYFYKLQNRQSVKIDFRHWSLSALAVPLKVRFGDGRQQYVSGANLGALLGHTWGKTNFLHRKGVGNQQFDTKLTFGGFLGADKLEYSFNSPDDKEVKVQTASLSTGVGLVFSYEGFTFGLTGGVDFALGENSSQWTYQGRPWLGAGIGYSLFKF